MGVLKTAFTMVTQTSSLQKAACRTSRLLSCAPVLLGVQRDAHTQDITKNIQYISQEKLQLRPDPATLKLDKSVDKPLCILINWILARQKHIDKYAAIYLDQGFDVVSVSCTPWQLLWPMKGSQLVAADLLRFIANNESLSPLCVHGFSVGGYMWGELLMHISKDAKYESVLDRVHAQVWDSAVDISELTVGVPAAAFPKNKVMQAAFKKYVEYHLRRFHEVATVHYMRSSQMFHLNMCKAPAIFFLSKSDPIGAEAANIKVADSWRSMGIPVTWKCWDRSPHVQHFAKHRKEYLSALYQHLASAGLIKQPQKLDISV